MNNMCDVTTIDTKLDSILSSTLNIYTLDGGQTLQAFQTVQRGGNVDKDGIQCDLANAHIGDGTGAANKAELCHVKACQIGV
jgi:hypothetical protein